MPEITYKKWDAGLDVRQGESVADANRLRILQNAYITNGKVPKKRPALDEAYGLGPNTHGLTQLDGKLQVFYDVKHPQPTVPAGVQINALSSVPGSPDIRRIHYAQHFNGYLYVVAEYIDDSVQHHYLDGSPDTRVTDANCPQSKLAIKRGQRIYAAKKDVVRYCKGANPRDWTPDAEPNSLSAGFLPVNIQADGNDLVKALAALDTYIVVWTDDHAQLWRVDADQTTNAFQKLLYVGARDHYAHAGMVGDVAFLSNAGVRSIQQQSVTDNVADVDIGTAIDDLFADETGEAQAVYVRKYSQFWVWFDHTYTLPGGETVNGTKVYVYTLSKTSKVSAWSTYLFPERIDYVAEAYQTVFIRTGDRISKLVDRDVYKDYGNPGTEDGYGIEVLIEMPFLDFKRPGVLKQLWAADMVFQGTAEFAIKYDSRTPDRQTAWQSVSGNSRPGGLFPVEAVSTDFAPVIRHHHNEPFQLDALTFHYFNLGQL